MPAVRVVSSVDSNIATGVWSPAAVHDFHAHTASHAGFAALSFVAQSLAIGAMRVTGTTHPPGGATALIAVIGSAKVKALGFWYVLMPAGAGELPPAR